MSWLAILQLSFSLMQQALSAFAQGQTKEAPHAVALAPQQVKVVESLLPGPVIEVGPPGG